MKEMNIYRDLLLRTYIYSFRSWPKYKEITTIFLCYWVMFEMNSIETRDNNKLINMCRDVMQISRSHESSPSDVNKHWAVSEKMAVKTFVFLLFTVSVHY